LKKDFLINVWGYGNGNAMALLIIIGWGQNVTFKTLVSKTKKMIFDFFRRF